LPGASRMVIGNPGTCRQFETSSVRDRDPLESAQDRPTGESTGARLAREDADDASWGVVRTRALSWS
jgi:hypothetical protein